MKTLLAITCLALSACASIPIPPYGDNAGALGFVEIGYRPNVLGTLNYLTGRDLPPPTSTKK